MLDAETRLVALLGDPIGHSRSPALHNAAFRQLGLDWAYVACRVERERLGEAIAGLRALNFAGANVTVPHKEAVMAHLDALTPTAETIGAVNTIIHSVDGQLLGDNTDADGFLRPLRSLRSQLDVLRDKPAVVLGAGGAARAVVYALLSEVAPSSLTLAARRPEQAERLAVSLGAWRERLRVEPLETAGTAVRQARLIVNTTPVGMHPDVEATVWPQAEDFGPGQIVYDLVYEPEQTRLLREAARQGATPIGGLEMLIGQAAAAFERWTGRSMPLNAVRATLQA